MKDFSKFKKSIKYTNKYTGEELELKCVYNEYANGGICLDLTCIDEDGFEEPYMRATVWTPELNMFDFDDNDCNVVAIKNYSEYEGLLDVLIEQDVINEPFRCVRSGFVMIPLCQLKEVNK